MAKKHESEVPTEMPDLASGLPQNREPVSAPAEMDDALDLPNIVPERPFYLSASIDVNWGWSNNYKTQLPIIGPKYGIPQADIDLVVANGTAFDAAMSIISEIDKWRGDWLTTRDALLAYKPKSALPIAWPTMPEFTKLPPAVPAWVLDAHVRTAQALLTNKNLSKLDRDTLGLVKAKGKPVPPDAKPRKKADDFKYPLVTYKVELGYVVITVKRGKANRKHMLAIQVDKEGKGKFEFLDKTNKPTYEYKIELPEGVNAATWIFRCIYMDGTTEVSEWSPATDVSVKPLAKV